MKSKAHLREASLGALSDPSPLWGIFLLALSCHHTRIRKECEIQKPDLLTCLSNLAPICTLALVHGVCQSYLPEETILASFGVIYSR